MVKIAIIGVNGSGKTTIFSLLTGKEPTHTAKSSVDLGIVKIPEPRLEVLQKEFNSKKTAPSEVEFIDVLGVAAKKKEVFPNAVREADVLMHIVRVFENQDYAYENPSFDISRDLKNLNAHLISSDLNSASQRIEKLEKSITRPTATLEQDKKELEILSKIKDALVDGRFINEIEFSDEDTKTIKGFCFLSEKPIFIILNCDEKNFKGASLKNFIKEDTIAVCGKLEQEIMELPKDERSEFLKDIGICELSVAKIIKSCYNVLDIITFFTGNQNEVRAWQAKKGDTALTCAGKVHSDIERGFIRAEVVNFHTFKELGSMANVKAKGKLTLVGKDYIVQDADIINFRFSV